MHQIKTKRAWSRLPWAVFTTAMALALKIVIPDVTPSGTSEIVVGDGLDTAMLVAKAGDNSL